MSRSLIQVANASPQTVAENGIIGLGSTQRRFGCNLNLSGNAIEANGPGYYSIYGSVTVAPTAIGEVTVAVYKDGEAIPGLVGSSYVGTAENPVAIPLVGTIRQGCCDSAANLTCVLVAGASVVQNVSLQVVKE